MSEHARLPLSSAQFGMWLADVADVDGGRCHIAEYFDIPARVDVDLFRTAWRRAFLDTEALRVRVVEEDGSPRQLVRTAPETDVRYLDLSEEDDPAARAVAWMTEDVARPTLLTGDDLYAVALFRIAENRYFWYQKCHHIALDGYGGALFAERVAEHYTALSEGRPAAPSGFGRLSDLIVEDVAYRDSQRYLDDRDHWARRLAGVRAGPIPFTERREARCGTVRCSAEVAVADWDLLRRHLGRAMAPSITAVFAGYLHRLTGVEDLLLAMPVAARRSPTARTTPGMVSNVVPLRLRVGGTTTFRELAEQTAQEARSALRHQRYRVEDLRRDLGIGPAERGFPGPAVNVMSFPYGFRFAGHQVTAHNLSNGPTDGLALAVYDRQDGTSPKLDLDGDLALFDQAELAAHLAGFTDLLRAVAADPDHRVGCEGAATAVVRPVSAGTRSDRRPESGGGLPVSDREQLLCGLVAEVLGLDEVAADGAFFELGGDSVLAIQLVAKARVHGLGLSLRDVFRHQTPAELAQVAASAAPRRPSDEGAGRVRPTPMVRWLEELSGSVDGFHQSVLLHAPADADVHRVGQVLRVLVNHHDLLRSRLTTVDGWRLEVPARGTVDVAPHVRRVDVEGLGEDELRRLIASHAGAARRRLAPMSGVMAQAVWFDAGERPGRLLLVLHHLVVDGTSWRILLDDIARLWEQIRSGRQDLVLPAPATSFRRWAEEVAAAATDSARVAELPFWSGVPAGPDARLGDRELDPSVDLAHRARRLSLVLEPDDAEPLLGTVPAAFHAGVEDVVVSALVLAVGEWRLRRTGTSGTDVLIDMEGHGRWEPAAGTDVSRTVGWFTALYPVRFTAGNVPEWTDVVRGGEGVAELVKQVKERLRAVPDRGVGHGLLRYVNADTASVLRAAASPQILFNYLGRVGVGGEEEWGLAGEMDVLPDGRDPGMPFSHALTADVLARDRCGRGDLHLTLTWPSGWVPDLAVAELGELWLDALRGITACVTGMRASTHTPADMTMTGLSQQEIDELESFVEGLV